MVNITVEKIMEVSTKMRPNKHHETDAPLYFIVLEIFIYISKTAFLFSEALRFSRSFDSKTGKNNKDLFLRQAREWLSYLVMSFFLYWYAE